MGKMQEEVTTVDALVLDAYAKSISNALLGCTYIPSHDLVEVYACRFLVRIQICRLRLGLCVGRTVYENENKFLVRAG